jgi:hypothetical protein
MTPAERGLWVLIGRANQLVNDIVGQQQHEAAAGRAEFRAGYELGFSAGREVGYGQAENDMAREWAALADKVRGLSSSVDLERRRWDGRREDFGKQRSGDYPGGTFLQKARSVAGRDWIGEAPRGFRKQGAA